MEKKESQPTLEELTSQIEDLKKQIRQKEREEKLAKEKAQSSNKKERKAKRKSGYPSKAELKSMGIHCKVVPVDGKALKYIDSDSAQTLKTTTRPHILPAIIKVLILLAIAAVALFFCIDGLSSSKTMEESSVYVVGIFLSVLIPSILMLKSAQLLDGYNTISSFHVGVLDWIAWLVDIVALIATAPVRVVSSFFRGTKRHKYAKSARLALPIGFGFDEIIEQGMELDSWASLTSVLDRMENYDKKAEANRQLDEIIKSAERNKVGETSEVQDEFNAVIEEAENVKSELED